MVDILHKIEAKAAPQAAYAALTTREGLAGWWTSDTRGNPGEGGVIEFYFGSGRVDMKVLELVPGKHVLWQVVRGPDDWMGNKITFELAPNARAARLSNSRERG